jgi:hypothetical protein
MATAQIKISLPISANDVLNRLVKKGKVILVADRGSQVDDVPTFSRQPAQMAVRSALQPPPPPKIPGTYFCPRLSGLQGHSAAGRTGFF